MDALTLVASLGTTTLLLAWYRLVRLDALRLAQATHRAGRAVPNISTIARPFVGRSRQP